jgi:hypothetical protein
MPVPDVSTSVRYSVSRVEYWSPRSRLAPLLVSLVLFGYGCSSSSAARIDSGLAGRVWLGPTCAVQRVGQSCERGYQTTLAVFTGRRRRLVTTFRSGPDGRFRLSIPPGRYTLKGTHRGIPRSIPTTVTVRPHRFTLVTIRFDTGLR